MPPAISGVIGAIEHNSVVTINGSGFGAHADFGQSESFLCAAYQDFSDDQYDSGNYYFEGPDDGRWAILTTDGRPQHPKYAKRINNDAGEGGEIGLWYTDVPIMGNRFYTTFWFKMKDYPEQQGGKFWRAWGGDQNVWVATGHGVDIDESNAMAFRGFSECAACSPSPTTLDDSTPQFLAFTWQRVEIFMAGSPSIFEAWLDLGMVWERSASNGYQWIPNPFLSDGEHTIGFGGQLDDDSRGQGNAGEWCFANPYISGTFARIELGNASTFDTCTVREIQIPYAWSTTSISAMINTGEFYPSDSAYLYVVDENRAVNSTGFPVTIGTGSAPEVSSRIVIPSPSIYRGPASLV